MNPTDKGTYARSSLRRRFWRAIVGEFTPPPRPRPTPSEEEFAEGHLAVGMINYAIEDSPGEVQGPDTLHIYADIPRHGTLPRTVPCPLSMPGSGRDLVGHSIPFRHTTFDPDYSNDILVVRWPPKVQEALKPVRYERPGALRARIWSILAGCSFAIMYSGIALTPVLLCDLVFGSIVGEFMVAHLLPGVHPGIALGASIGVVPAGLFLTGVCRSRRDAALGHQSGEGRP